MLEVNRVYQGDCIDVMKDINDHSIDMILCDLPYGITECKWDIVIPLEPLWEAYERIIKDNGAIILTASQPFTSMLVMSNLKLFRYSWVWLKSYITGFMNAHKMPLKSFEDCLVFYKKLPTYNPQGIIPLRQIKKQKRDKDTTIYRNMGLKDGFYKQEYTNYPKDRIETFSKEETYHPTQKPFSLFAYLIKTYTNGGDLVLDNCGGSGTTGMVCKKFNRNFILIEKDAEYCKMSTDRINGIIYYKTLF